MKTKGIHGKWLEITLHSAAWAFLFFVPIYLFTSEMHADKFFLARVYTRTLIFAIIFYINYFLLIPKLLFRQKPIRYYISAAILIVGLYVINIQVNHIINEQPGFQTQRVQMEKLKPEDKYGPRHPWRFDIYNFFFTSILISGFSIGLRMAGRYSENEKKRKELEKEMLNSELAFLKNQVSPHFFFNTLNNIYSLVEINPADAQKAILQLSKMMRYMLYESEQGNTLLSTEIEFMRNYIELMKLRLSDKVKLDVTFPENFTDFNLPPLLFVPFIENSFKHGISYRDASFIKIGMVMIKNELIFTCSNSLIQKKENDAKDRTGIGLDNVRKRLMLLFPDKHTLEISTNNEIFLVTLKIEIS